MSLAFDLGTYSSSHALQCANTYRSPSASSDSSNDSSQSAESIASSQTSYSSQEQWQNPTPVKAATSATKAACLPALQTNVSQHQSHPRRTSRDACPPSLVRQHERKGQFVYHLVDSATYLVETIWPTSAPAHNAALAQAHQSMLPLRTFIEETLRRSKTSFSTLQVALFYLILLKDHIPLYDFTMEQRQDCSLIRALQCGRRMFLAALILGSKYLQDRNYSARAWSKISGLKVCEINLNERALLAAVNWKLHIPEPTFNCWQDILVKYSNPSMVSEWRKAIRRITPEFVANYRSSPMNTQRTVPASSGYVPQANASPVASPLWSASVQSPIASSPFKWDARRTSQSSVASNAFKLTTPSPMSSFCPTPAVSMAGDMLRCTSQPRAMGSAMCMAKSAANIRSCMDFAPMAMNIDTSDRFSRRSSVASNISRSTGKDSVSPSVASSPGSMISDDDSSRSSSISSVSLQSQNTSPVRNFLPRLATRNAMHKFVDTSAAVAAVSEMYDECVTVLDSEPLNNVHLTASPEVIVIEDESTPTQRCLESTRESRKRHRTSVDLASADSVMQSQVRNLLRQSLVHTPAKHHTSLTHDHPHNSLGSVTPVAKKACYANEAHYSNGFVRPHGGPGMWKDILQ